MNVGIVIQARLGSKRFPRKVLAKLGGVAVLDRVIDRCKQICSRIILATPDEELMGYRELPSILGPEEDVLQRYLLAAQAQALDLIMRITSDCPFINPTLCKETFALYEEGQCRLASIGWPMTYPKGYGCEVFSKYDLELAARCAFQPYDREHVTPWMERNLRCSYLTQDKDESHLNYSVDVPGDIPRLEKEISALGG